MRVIERGHGSVVERLLPKQNVAGSNPAARSSPPPPGAAFFIAKLAGAKEHGVAVPPSNPIIMT